MSTDATTTDRSFGFGVLFALLALLAALVMLFAALGDGQLVAGWGFAAAMVAGGLLIAVIHAA